RALHSFPTRRSSDLLSARETSTSSFPVSERHPWPRPRLLARAVLLRHEAEEIHDTVRVAPLVVVPGDNLEEPLLAFEVVLERRARGVDRRPRVVDEVGRDELLVAVAEDP